MKYARENGCPWNAVTCSNAALNGHLECLKYAHKNGCPWDEKTCSEAALKGHFECLKYAHENGCPWDEETFTNHTSHARESPESHFFEQLRVTQYLFSKRCPGTANAIFSMMRDEMMQTGRVSDSESDSELDSE